LANPKVDLVELEKSKIKGAIRTDFILSAQIVVIVLGTVQSEPFSTQVDGTTLVNNPKITSVKRGSIFIWL